MIGIPYRLLRDTEEGPVDKTVYLATRRSGEAGQAMKEAKRAFHKHEMAVGRAYKRYQSLDVRVRRLEASGADSVDQVIEQRDEAFARIQEEADLANDAAEKVVRLSLKENYHDQTDSILDICTDKDLAAMVVVIETGELPKDFFGSGGPPPKSSSTEPSGDSPEEPSTDADLPDDR